MAELQVRYIEYFADGTKERCRRYACFAPIYKRSPNPDPAVKRIIYLANVNSHVTSPVLTVDQCEKYLRFLQAILDAKRFTYRIFQFKKTGKIYIHFSLDCTNLSRPHALMYLTAFRYPDEFPAFVKDVADQKTTDIEQIFDRFQTTHRPKAAIADTNAHSLMYGYIFRHEKNLSLEEFKINQKLQRSSVNNFWQSHPYEFIYLT